MRPFLLFLLLTNTFNCFAQNRGYKSVYECVVSKAGSLKDLNDTANKSALNLELTIQYTVRSNGNFSYIIGKATGANYPIPISGGEEEILIDFKRALLFRLTDKTSCPIISRDLTATKNRETILDYLCDTYLYTGARKGQLIKIWVSSKLPAYVNPGIYNKNLPNGIVKLQSPTTIIELKTVVPDNFNFTRLIERARLITKKIEAIDLLKEL